MNIKELSFSSEARELIRDGVVKLAAAVKSTLGPRGKNVVIEREFGVPHSTKDGVTVAKEIVLENQFENLGAELVKQAAAKTNDAVGDGTTTSTVLAESIFLEGLRYLEDSSINATALRFGIDKCTNVVVEHLGNISTKISNNAEIQSIATISANNDIEIGKLISSAVEKIGPQGIILVEEGKTSETTLRISEGVTYDRGYISPYFITNHEKGITEYSDVLIFLYDGKLTDIRGFTPVLSLLAESKRPVLFIANEFSTDILNMLVVNKLKNNFQWVAVSAPGFGERRKEILKDIAIFSNGQVFGDDPSNILFDEFNSTEDLSIDTAVGFVSKVVVSKNDFTLVEGRGESAAITERAEEIKASIEQTSSEYDKDKLFERLAKLVAGVAVIEVGALTDSEFKEKKDRVEDAVQATKAALEEGIVPGGGLALVRCIKALDSIELEDDQALAVQLMRFALSQPLKQIAINAGLDGDAVVTTVLKHSGNYGFNAASRKFGDLFEQKIIDPTKVVRVALQNAVSIASLMLSTECLVINNRKYMPKTDNMI